MTLEEQILDAQTWADSLRRCRGSVSCTYTSINAGQEIIATAYPDRTEVTIKIVAFVKN